MSNKICFHNSSCQMYTITSILIDHDHDRTSSKASAPRVKWRSRSRAHEHRWTISARNCPTRWRCSKKTTCRTRTWSCSYVRRLAQVCYIPWSRSLAWGFWQVCSLGHTFFILCLTRFFFLNCVWSVEKKEKKKCKMYHLTCHSNGCFCKNRVFEG